jgi:hypothetical protein
MVMAAIETPEIVGLVAAFVSIFLAAFAIFQATIFFRWSDQASKETTGAARDIAASVEKLEKLFDTFYRDTFGLVKDQFTDYREIWRSSPTREQVEKMAEGSLEQLKQEMRAEIERITVETAGEPKDVETLRAELQDLLDRTIDKTRNVDIEVQVVALKPLIKKRIEEMEARGISELKWGEFAEPFPSGGGIRKALWKAFKELGEAGEVEYTMHPEPGPNQATPGANKVVRFNFN